MKLHRLRPPVTASKARHETFDVIFGHDTKAGRNFDLVLIVAILASVLVVMLESVASIRSEYGGILRAAEWVFTVAFTVEYVLRLWSVGRPFLYARSGLGLIDLVSILPTYLSVLLPGGQVLAVVRILRVLRVFRILRLAHYSGEASVLMNALRASRYKITVFVFAVMTIVAVVGSLMFLVEGPEGGFTSIPRGVYWAVVTLTTVGYGDIAPQSALGQALATVVMVMGYGIIAVPTGIVTAEIAFASRPSVGRRACEACSREGHDRDAEFCKWCGAGLGRSGPNDEE
ncbi:ion transporter [Gaopeijia maritima]|uniref:Ion transporter n=1 Tax=Gaopeijia maritima TaxID=3119007 RepID=A0ABU9EC96_9BACT